MGIKRCPSFSKRPGFPCGLRVLLMDGDSAARSDAESLLKDCSYTVTPCSTTAEALSHLSSGSSFDVLLADKAMVSGKVCDRQQLLDSCKGLPCILMALNPSPDDIMAGIQLGAVDFLAKPLSPLKLQNIWQHTVRKMMGNMNINCSSDSAPAGSTAAPPGTATAVPAAARKELDAMEVIPEEPEQEQQAAASDAVACNTNSGSAAPSTLQLKRPAVNTAANVALATTSSLYEPARCPSLSRSGSSAATDVSLSLATAGSDSPTKGPAGSSCKLHKSRHAPVHSCPSTRSLNSMASSYSTLQLALPPTPGSPSSGTAAELAAAAADTAGTYSNASGQQLLQQQRSIKKAVRHPTPVTPASKPPLASKPQAAAAAVAAATQASAGAAAQQQQQQPAAGTAAPSCTGKTGVLKMGSSSVPMPTGLGPLPQGMVWGMPMCPLARAPGIVPPGSGTSTSTSQHSVPAAAGTGMMMPPMSAWGMCGMPMGMPPVGIAGMPSPFMPGFMMPPMPPMGMPFGSYGAAAPGMMMAGYGMPDSSGAYEAAAMQQQQDAAAAAAAPVSCLPLQPQQLQAQASAGGCTGAAAAAALNASLGGGAADATTAALDIGDAFDFMLGDITAEDDLDVGMIHSGLLDGELTALEKEGLKLPADLAELQEQQQHQQRYQQLQQQQQQRMSFECGSSRLSFDCHGRQRVSFDCSTASTTTGARVSFECSAASRGGINSQRVSFEVNCTSAAGQAAAPAPAGFCAEQQHQKQAAAPAAAAAGKAAAAVADPLLGSMSELFAACSGDSCSEGSGGMTHVDSCGMLADLQSLFGPGEGCAGVNDDGCSGVAAAAAGLFDDVMDDLPMELSMKKSSSLVELLNAGLTAMQA